MPKKTPESFNYLSNDPEFVPDPEIEEFMEEEIAHAPKDPDLLAQRLHNNTAASPSDAGGDLDADWEDVNEAAEVCRRRQPDSRPIHRRRERARDRRQF